VNVVLYVAKLLADVVVAAAALGLIVWAWRYVRELLDRAQWTIDVAVADPADAQLWDVLAEARSITENAARGDDATG
jgi:hypothetical protein